MVRTRGVRSIAKKWAEAPTFIMDATLPELAILRIFYPAIEIVADIDATMPHVTVRQVLGAPVSAKKLGIKGSPRGSSRQRGTGTSRRSAAPSCCASRIRAQADPRHRPEGGRRMAEGERICRSASPSSTSTTSAASISTATSGYLDHGRADLAQRVRGRSPRRGADRTWSRSRRRSPAGPRWFDRITRGIRLKDGTGYAVEGDVHPDPMAEAIRWQICEGELVQAIGRARGVNRTAATPLAVDIMADVVLPLTVDEVVQWPQVPAGAEVEMLADGHLARQPERHGQVLAEGVGDGGGSQAMAGAVHTVPNPYKEYSI